MAALQRPSPGTDSVTTVVIGVGNPILRDDGVGLEVARLVRRRSAGNPDLTVTELCAGGLRLMESMVGYDRAIIVDAMNPTTTAGHPPTPGTVREFVPDSATPARNLRCAHDSDLAGALALARAMDMALPSEIRIFVVEAAEIGSFGEELSPLVRQAVPALVDRILALAALKE